MGVAAIPKVPDLLVGGIMFKLRGWLFRLGDLIGWLGPASWDLTTMFVTVWPPGLFLIGTRPGLVIEVGPGWLEGRGLKSPSIGLGTKGALKLTRSDH